MWTCGECGTVASDDRFKFCEECGAKRAVESADPEPPEDRAAVSSRGGQPFEAWKVVAGRDPLFTFKFAEQRGTAKLELFGTYLALYDPPGTGGGAGSDIDSFSIVPYRMIREVQYIGGGAYKTSSSSSGMRSSSSAGPRKRSPN